ncbi:hypothetical protein CICLE_v10002953mg [Citrus x clementina]|uniref:Uncharacterized protein n=2 Tax=Citrus TaxID=2706 RepID=A0A067ELI2_CITSI|nr:hypothetical protein CICLE_v10002953mg [Citrus x clementina]KDO52057.1 hypothetical protein CISIN_1g041544mg [Citrus sinensis]
MMVVMLVCSVFQYITLQLLDLESIFLIFVKLQGVDRFRKHNYGERDYFKRAMESQIELELYVLCEWLFLLPVYNCFFLFFNKILWVNPIDHCNGSL